MEDAWLVTVTVQMTVKGADTREEAKEAAWRRLEEFIRAGKEVPYRADARRMKGIDAEEPLFGQKWD